MPGDIHVDDATPVMRQHDEHKQDAERGGRDREEVDRGELGDVIGEERAPRLRRGPGRRPRYFATVDWCTLNGQRRLRFLRIRVFVVTPDPISM
jgi:hypothetical protein